VKFLTLLDRLLSRWTDDTLLTASSVATESENHTSVVADGRYKFAGRFANGLGLELQTRVH